MPTEDEKTTELDSLVAQVIGADLEKLTPEEIKANLEKAREALKKRNAELAERRTKLKKFEDDEHAREEAAKTELQKAQEQLTALQKQIEEQKESGKKQAIRHAVEMAAAQLGFAAPEDAYTLADLSGVEIDAAGKVKGVDEALKELLKKKPYLAGKPGGQKTPDIDARNKGGAQGPDVNELIAQKRSEYSGL